MYFSQDDVFTLFGGTDNCPLDQQTALREVGPIEIRTQFHNYLGTEATIVLRSGLSTFIPCETPSRWRSYAGQFVVRTTIFINARICRSVAECMHYVPRDATLSPRVLLAIRKSFDEQVPDNKSRNVTIILDTVVSLEELRQHGDSVYLDEVDVVVTLKQAPGIPAHPQSVLGRQYDMQRQARNTNPGNAGFFYNLELIDNLDQYGPRYIRLGEHVFKLDVKRDRSRPDGIYLTSQKPVKGSVTVSGVHTQYYTFEDAQKTLGVFNNYNEALFDGDIASQRKREIQDMEFELHKLRSNNAREKEEFERERLRLERELQKETERNDRAAHVRKVFLETLKYLPAAIIGIGSAYTAVRAIKKK